MSEKKEKKIEFPGKYGHLLTQDLRTEHRPFDPQNSPYMVPNFEFFDDIDGARPNFAVYYIMRTGMFMEGPHYHTADETLYFVSSDPRDMKNLGATVEIAFEESWEKYTITESCLVRFPAGVVHCPIYVRELERPFLFGHYWPTGEPAHFIAAGKKPETAKAGAPE